MLDPLGKWSQSMNLTLHQTLELYRSFPAAGRLRVAPCPGHSAAIEFAHSEPRIFIVTSHSSRTLSANPYAAWTRLALAAGEMLFASAQVITYRVSRMAAATNPPSARDRKEFTLMGQEKIVAATASVQAMATQALMVNAQLSGYLLRQFLSSASHIVAGNPFTFQGQQLLMREMMRMSSSAAPQLSNSITRVAHRGLRPIHLRATKNARRLARH